jgi:hypothetical protein
MFCKGSVRIRAYKQMEAFLLELFLLYFKLLKNLVVKSDILDVKVR